MGTEEASTDIIALLISIASPDLDDAPGDDKISEVGFVISSLEKPSARASLAAQVNADEKVFGECSSEGGYKRAVSVLANALVMEAKWESAEHVDSLATAICHLVAQHDLADGDAGDLTSEAKGEVTQLLGSSTDAVATVVEAFLSVARQVVGDSNKGWYAPALVISDACLAVEPSSELRRDLVDLLGRRVFNNTTPATAKEITLCSSLIQDLSKEEFDGSIIRPLKFNLASSPGATMGTLAAFIEELNEADKGTYLRSYLAGMGNIVPSALKQVTADDTEHSSGASAVMVGVVRACPNEGAQVVSKALASAVQQEPSAPLYDCLEEVGTVMLEKKGTPDAAKYGSLADNDVVPVLEKGNEEDSAGALSVWAELQEASTPPPAAMPGAQAVSKADERIAAKSAAAPPGAQAVSKADERIAAKSAAAAPGAQAVSKVDERIAAKSAGAKPPPEGQQRTDRENAKAAAFAMAGGAGVAAAATAAANSNEDVKPGVEHVSENARIKQQARGGAAPATAPGVQSVQNKQLDDLDQRIQRKTHVPPATKPDGNDKIPESKKTIVVASHQIAGSEHEDIKVKEAEMAAPSITEEFHTSGGKPGEPFHETFHDEPGSSVTRREGDGGAPVDNVDRGIINGPDIEYGDGGMDDGPGLVEAVQVDPDEEEEFIPAAVEFDPDSKKPPIYRDPKIRNRGIAVLCVVVALAVGLSVGLTKSLNTDDIIVEKTDAPSSQPTAAPTSFRDKSIVNEHIESLSVIDGASYEFARNFILNEDDLQLTIEEDTATEDTERITQRYALSAFAYATNSTQWYYCGTPIDKTGKCVYDYLDRQQGGKFVLEKRSTWLSHHHECSWYGVLCNKDNKVVGIDMINNNLAGPLSSVLTLLKKDLQKLDFAGNKLTGEIPPEIGELKALRELKLTTNNMKGEIPEELYDLTLLENIVLGGNDFSGQISTKIGQLTSLKGFHMFNTLVDGPIPSEIGELSFLNILRLHDCAFTGTLPSEITKLERLTQLWNYKTLMTGVLPENIGDMIDLELLYINESRYSGSLPASFYKLSNLKEFLAWDIKSDSSEPKTTGINGTISPAIKDMTELLLFIARGNSFEGQLPDEFGDLTKLSVIWLHHNGIFGESPFCEKTNPNIQRQQYGSVEMDCLEFTHENGTVTPPQVSCPCCTVCCDIAKVCRHRDA